MKKRIITYNDYDHLLDKLVEKIQMSSLYGELKYVYGPPRGGLPIAVHLAHHLDLKLIDRGLLNEWDQDELDRTLIVDDIADTGRTIESLNGFYKTNFIFATLFFKSRSIIEPDWYVELENKWVIFPWEKLDEKPNRTEIEGA